MKLGKNRKSSLNKEDFLKKGFKFDSDYTEYCKVIKAVNELRCKIILEHEEGHSLPFNLGRIIILKVKPRVKQVYSMTKPGTKLSNLHSYGWIYRVMHKEKLLMRYPALYNFRPHRQNLKMPLYNNIMNGLKEYFPQSDFL